MTSRSRPDTRRRATKKVRRRPLREASQAVYRDGIVQAAERVFVRAGFTKVTMSDIAREAGLAAGTLYNYFDSKEQIFRTLLESRGDQFLAELEQVRGSDARERLGGLIAAVLSYIERHRSTFALFVELGGMAEWSIRHVAGVKSERLYDRYLGLIEEAIRDGIREGVLRDDLAVGEQVACLTGIINGVVRMGLVTGASPVRDRAPFLLDVCLRGLGSRTP